MNPADRFGQIAVVMGGESAEREVSLASGRAVLDALRSQGIQARGFDPHSDHLSDLVNGQFDAAFNVLHGPGGENGELQGFLDCHGMAYTGSGVLASALTMDKLQSKRVLRAEEIATPDWCVAATEAALPQIAQRLGLPLVVKPVAQGSSVGVSLVHESAQLVPAFEKAAVTGDLVMCEAFVSGPEHAITVIAGQVMPSVRIETPREFYDYEAKYEADTTQYVCPGLTPGDEVRYQELALQAFETCGLRGWGRVDFLTDAASGQPFVIELNTVPGMTSHSLVPRATAAHGWDFATTCLRILEASDIGSAAEEKRDGA